MLTRTGEEFGRGEIIDLVATAYPGTSRRSIIASFAKGEMRPTEPGAIQFKLGDLGVARLFTELDASNTLAEWMRPPEAIDPTEFGPVDHRIDIYHIGLLFLQLVYSKPLQFSRGEILAGRIRDMALSLPAPYTFAFEKTLRRHVAHRTAAAMEFWRDLYSSQPISFPESSPLPALGVGEDESGTGEDGDDATQNETNAHGE